MKSSCFNLKLHPISRNGKKKTTKNAVTVISRRSLLTPKILPVIKKIQQKIER